MNKIHFRLLLSFLFLAYSCKESHDEEKPPVIQLPEDKVVQLVKTYEDSAKSAWEAMIQEDDQKIADIKRLLEEISYTPKYNVLLQAQLLDLCKKLKGKRFDEHSVIVSENIDKYDAATDSLVKRVNELVMATPNIENYPLAQELTSEIMKLDNNVVVRRIAYDKWAMEYNKLLEEQKSSLEKIDPAYANLPKKGTFQIES